MKWFFVFTLGMLTSFASLACDFFIGPQKTCGKIQFLAGPSAKTESKFQLTVEAAEFKALEVLPWMDHGHGGGHGTDEVAVERLEDGSFLVSDVYFTMKGKWELRMKFTDDSGEVFNAQYYVKVP